MKLKLTLFSVSIICSVSTIADTNEEYAFKSLKNAIANYSSKVEECRSLQSENKLTSDEVSKLKSLSRNISKALIYLGEKALNTCLQPERGYLAEQILYSRETDTHNPTFKLAESTRSMVFKQDLSYERYFNELSQDDKKLLLSITSLKSPFDELNIYEQLTNTE